MTAITSFGAMEHRMVSDKINAALKAIGDELGVDFNASGGQIGDLSGVIKVAVSVRSTSSGLNGKEQEFKRNARYVGAEPEWFGKTFEFRGDTFKVYGINVNAHKYGVSAECLRTKRSFKFPASTVRAGVK